MIRVEVPRPANVKDMKAEGLGLNVQNDAACFGFRMALTANEYQGEALRTAGEHVGNSLLVNGVMGLNGEAGECIDIVKKHLFQGHELDKEKLAKELGDVAWYLAVTAHAIGYTLEDVMRGNMKKLRARYPEGFDPEKSLHRKEGDV